MKKLYKKAIEAYVEMLMIHIETKTKDHVFHKITEDFYETLFDIAHDIWEKNVDLGNNLSENKLDSNKAKERANEIISKLRKDIEEYKNENEITLGTEDLLGSIANKLEQIEWDSKSFLK